MSHMDRCFGSLTCRCVLKAYKGTRSGDYELPPLQRRDWGRRIQSSWSSS